MLVWSMVHENTVLDSILILNDDGLEILLFAEVFINQGEIRKYDVMYEEDDVGIIEDGDKSKSKRMSRMKN